jgi:hypothetical protein
MAETPGIKAPRRRRRPSLCWPLQAFAVVIGGVLVFSALFLAAAMGSRGGRALTFCRVHDLVTAQADPAERRILVVYHD